MGDVPAVDGSSVDAARPLLAALGECDRETELLLAVHRRREWQRVQ